MPRVPSLKSSPRATAIVKRRRPSSLSLHLTSCVSVSLNVLRHSRLYKWFLVPLLLFLRHGDTCDLFKGQDPGSHGGCRRDCVLSVLPLTGAHGRRAAFGCSSRGEPPGGLVTAEHVLLDGVAWTRAVLPERRVSLSEHHSNLCPPQAPSPFETDKSPFFSGPFLRCSLSLCLSQTPLPAPDLVLTGPGPSVPGFCRGLSWPVDRHTPQGPPHCEMRPLHLRDGLLSLLHCNLN